MDDVERLVETLGELGERLEETLGERG